MASARLMSSSALPQRLLRGGVSQRLPLAASSWSFSPSPFLRPISAGGAAFSSAAAAAAPPKSTGGGSAEAKQSTGGEAAAKATTKNAAAAGGAVAAQPPAQQQKPSEMMAMGDGEVMMRRPIQLAPHQGSLLTPPDVVGIRRAPRVAVEAPPAGVEGRMRVPLPPKDHPLRPLIDPRLDWTSAITGYAIMMSPFFIAPLFMI